MMRGWSRDSVWMRAGSWPVKMPAYLKNAWKARFVTTEPTSQCFAAVLLSLS